MNRSLLLGIAGTITIGGIAGCAKRCLIRKQQSLTRQCEKRLVVARKDLASERERARRLGAAVVSMRHQLNATMASGTRWETAATAYRQRLQTLSARLGVLERVSAGYHTLATERRSRSARDRRQLETLRQTLETLRRSLTDQLRATSHELALLTRESREATLQAKAYTQLTHSLRRLIDADAVSVAIVRGRVAIRLRSAVLFDAGKAIVKPNGRTILQQVARELRPFFKSRYFQVAGHTDSSPVPGARAQTRWELSTARATRVVQTLERLGLPARRLSAGGFAEHQPVGGNDTPAGRALNRRIEITLLPVIPARLLSK
ncbi:MAG: OmpA family protein [bacterium]